MGFRVITDPRRIGGHKTEIAGFPSSPIPKDRHTPRSNFREYATENISGLSFGNVDIPRLRANSASQGPGQACPINSCISRTLGNPNLEVTICVQSGLLEESGQQSYSKLNWDRTPGPTLILENLELESYYKTN